MRIAVLVKYVPDAAGDRHFTPIFTTERDAVQGLLCELDEYAIEQALQLVETAGEGQVTVLTMGPDNAAPALSRALSMGADDAVHIVDDCLAGSDALATSLVLAAALARIDADLILTGMASTDAGLSVIPAMVAERLSLPLLSFASALRVEGKYVTIRRDDDEATETITTTLPAVVSVTDRTGEARYPSFKGILAAKKKHIERLSLAGLGIDPAQVGLLGAMTVMSSVSRTPSRAAGVKVLDEGSGGIQAAAYLAANGFI
ncbi:MAG: electron transfer flavoprotein subunit beta/FixA family protein [Actinomycetota bacterium]|nr:electron transfer flavoprotein subunit beta/FixA family protein [Actinomycetota bacterium]MDP1877318.1 electron transfer flavoprotein subunit beta/FixA family protein [Actinomycetota bacterium]